MLDAKMVVEMAVETVRMLVAWMVVKKVPMLVA